MPVSLQMRGKDWERHSLAKAVALSKLLVRGIKGNKTDFPAGVFHKGVFAGKD